MNFYPNPDGPAPLSVLLEEFYRDITCEASFKHVILLAESLIVTPLSALAQEQQSQNTMTTATTMQQPPRSNSTEQQDENNKALVRSFIEEVFNQQA